MTTFFFFYPSMLKALLSIFDCRQLDDYVDPNWTSRQGPSVDPGALAVRGRQGEHALALHFPVARGVAGAS